MSLGSRWRRNRDRIRSDMHPLGAATGTGVYNYLNSQNRDATGAVMGTLDDERVRNEALTQEELARMRDEYDRRRRANRTQTILTSGTGASGTPETSRPTLLGGR